MTTFPWTVEDLMNLQLPCFSDGHVDFQEFPLKK